MFIIFEGLDKAGKTTLQWELLRATNFKHVNIDRGPVGYMVFDKLLGRETSAGNEEYIRMINEINDDNNFIVIYCHCNEDVVKDRLIKTNHENLKYDYIIAQNILRHNIYKYYENVIDVDTDNTIENCVKYIINECSKFENFTKCLK